MIEDDHNVYGSFVSRSRRNGRQYILVNAKTAEYLSYELTWLIGGLHTTLVCSFHGRLGGKVEGCVANEADEWLIMGEGALAAQEIRHETRR